MFYSFDYYKTTQTLFSEIYIVVLAFFSILHLKSKTTDNQVKQTSDLELTPQNYPKIAI